MTSLIHPTAIISPKANIGSNVKIGPYCIVGENVVLHDDVELVSHVSIEGRTSVGARTRIFPFASIGTTPQDLKFHGEESSVIIGEDNSIREYVTIHPGTSGGGLVTRVGNNCLLMIAAHVAHDCIVGNNVVLSNQVSLAGHCIIEDYARLGGMSGLHQFVRIGSHAFVGAMSLVDGDVIPYGSVIGNRATLGGLNLIGLKRNGFERKDIHRLRSAYKDIFFGSGTLAERVEDAAVEYSDDPLAIKVINFIRTPSQRSLCLPVANHGDANEQ